MITSSKKLGLVFLLAGTAIVLPGLAMADSEICRMESGFLDGNIGRNYISNGISGTGAPLEELSIDRTHIDEKGIGGTGSPYKTVHIRGTVYAFGSMCVNGLRVHYGDITKVSDSNGNSLFHKSILLGHVVDIRASVNPEDNSLHAQEVTVHGFSSGKVTKILEDEQSFILDNQQVVHLADEALFKLVKIGQSYEVTGMLDDKNILSASLIEPLDETSPSQISENGALLAQADLMNSIGDYFSIEGYIEGVKENNVVNVSGIDYQVTTLECGDGPITVGERVIAMGKVLEDGSMRIEGFIDIHEPKIFTQK